MRIFFEKVTESEGPLIQNGGGKFTAPYNHDFKGHGVFILIFFCCFMLRTVFEMHPDKKIMSEA